MNDTKDRHRPKIDAVRRAVLDVPGTTSQKERQSAYESAAGPDLLSAYLAKVRSEAWSVTDEDVVALTRAGYTEDAILELTLAAIVGEAGRRYDRANRLVFGAE